MEFVTLFPSMTCCLLRHRKQRRPDGVSCRLEAGLSASAGPILCPEEAGITLPRNGIKKRGQCRPLRLRMTALLIFVFGSVAAGADAGMRVSRRWPQVDKGLTCHLVTVEALKMGSWEWSRKDSSCKISERKGKPIPRIWDVAVVKIL